MRWVWCIVCLCILEWTALAIEPDHNIHFEKTDCASKESCHECIVTPKCAWCKEEKFEDESGSPKKRCNSMRVLMRGGCRDDYIISPENSQEIIDDRELSFFAAGESSSKRIVQMKPQHVSLKLRVREEHSLKILYARAKDYPVDLYYLMDLSKSMEDDKQKLAKLGNSIAERMKTLTGNFRLGFGSFVDKVVMPYVNTVPEKLQTPCPGCDAPYGFKNHMPLSNRSEQFESSVEAARVSGNLDGPEGGFDAVMQAMACPTQIGWRPEAHRLLVFSTDASFHYAGDGKLGGIVTPNDGECHMEKGQYTHSELLDYPSVSMINKKAIFTSTRIIFAVTSDQKKIYEQLKDSIIGASVGVLEGDSSNVVKLIETEYKNIRSKVELQESGSSEHVSVDFYSNCLNKDQPRNKTSKCGELEFGKDVVEFACKIKVNRIPENRKQWHQTIVVQPVGEPDKLVIDLEIIGDCDCEYDENQGFQNNSEICQARGSLQCGKCVCDDLYYGRYCKCSKKGTEIATAEEDTDKCKPPGSDIICSGRGKCECNECICDEADSKGNRYDGAFCECDDFSCERHNGELCNGPEHGICDCGNCTCLPGWTGSSCKCPTGDEMCIQPGDTEPCSGQGECKCGKCKCDNTKHGHYFGDFCQEPPTIYGRCYNISYCVQCQVFKSGKLTQDECRNQSICYYLIEEDYEVKAMEGEESCTFTDTDDCQFKFVYGLYEPNETLTGDNEKIMKVRVEKTKECPLAINILAIVAGLIVAIVAVGLAILCIWKIFTTIHDRREYAKFEKEKMMAKWDTGENPIYKQATSTFKNPTYGGKG